MIHSSFVSRFYRMEDNNPALIRFYGGASPSDASRFKPVLILQNNVLRKFPEFFPPIFLLLELFKVVTERNLNVGQDSVHQDVFPPDFARKGEHVFMPQENVYARFFLVVGSEKRVGVFELKLVVERVKLAVSDLGADDSLFLKGA